MNRRGFLGILAAAAAIDPELAERLTWRRGERLISIPAPPPELYMFEVLYTQPSPPYELLVSSIRNAVFLKAAEQALVNRIEEKCRQTGRRPRRFIGGGDLRPPIGAVVSDGPLGRLPLVMQTAYYDLAFRENVTSLRVKVEI